MLFLSDLIWINRFFNEKCVFSFTRQFDGSRRDRYIRNARKPSVNKTKNSFNYICSIEKRGMYALLREGHRMYRWARSCRQAATSRNVDFGLLFQKNAAYVIIGTNGGLIRA